MKSRSNPITMQQVADKLNLSRLTVSSVVNGKALQRGIPEKTVRRVQDYLDEHGFVRSRQATSLRLGKRSAIGILHSGHLFSHLTDAFNQMIDVFSVQEDGLEIMVAPRAKVIEGLSELISRGIRDLVWIQSGLPYGELFENQKAFRLLTNVNTIFYNHHFDHGEVDRRLTDAGIHLVGVDRYQAYCCLAKMLSELGHQRITLPNTTADSNRHPDNYVIKAFKLSNIEVFPSGGVHPEKPGAKKIARSCVEGVLHAMATHQVTAACFGDDEVAGFAIPHLMEHGVRIPEELSITGFDGIALAEAFPVSLTTLRMPVCEMVQKVSEISQKEPQSFRHCFEMELVKRKSHSNAPH